MALLSSLCGFYLLLSALCPFSAFGDFHDGCTNETYTAWSSGWPRVLDWGVYWFGKHDVKEKAEHGKSSNLFDPSKKTVIFIHGWTGGPRGSPCFRTTTYLVDDMFAKRPYLMDQWVDKGWNVGFFYWDQFGDEPCTRDAEQKIWFDEGKLRYRTYILGAEDPDVYETLQEDYTSVADLCAHAIDDAMEGFTGSELRVIGHSLGTQVATRCTTLLKLGGSKLRLNQNHPELENEKTTTTYSVSPTQLVLLDPFFTKRHFLGLFRCKSFNMHSGIGEYTLKESTKEIKLLHGEGVPPSIHMSSMIPEFSIMDDTIFPLEPFVVLVKHNIQWCGKVDKFHLIKHISILDCEHNGALPNYFFVPDEIPSECTPAHPFACSNKELWTLQAEQLALAERGQQQLWVQDKGQTTIDPNDDEFREIVMQLTTREKEAVGNIGAMPGTYHPGATSGKGSARIWIGALLVGGLLMCITATLFRRRKSARKAARKSQYNNLKDAEGGRNVPAE